MKKSKKEEIAKKIEILKVRADIYEAKSKIRYDTCLCYANRMDQASLEGRPADEFDSLKYKSNLEKSCDYSNMAKEIRLIVDILEALV